MKNFGRITDRRSSSHLVLVCWFVYMTAYIGRNTFKAAMEPIIAAGVLTNSTAGLIGTCYFICYGMGHMINGYLADRLHPFNMIVIGVGGSALCNLIMATVPPYPVMLLTWALNGFLQSMLWSPILWTDSNLVQEGIVEKACYWIAFSTPIGTLLAYLAVSLTAGYDFRLIFVIGALCLLTVLFFFLLVSHRAAKFIPRTKPEPEEKSAVKAEKAAPAKAGEPSSFLSLFLRSGAPLIILSILCHGMLKEGVLTWVPSMISDTYHTSPAFSVFITMLLPIANLCGMFISNVMYRVFRRHDTLNALFFMGITLLPITAVLFMRSLPLPVIIVSLALISMFMMAYNYMVSTTIPLRFLPYGRVATFSGLFNSMVYVGSALSTYGFGLIAEKVSWSATVAVWFFIALAGALLLLPILRKWRRFSKENAKEDVPLS